MNQDIFIVCAKKNWRTGNFAASKMLREAPSGAAARGRKGSFEARHSSAERRRSIRKRSHAEAHDDLVAVAHHVLFSFDVLQARRLHLTLRAESQKIVNCHDFGPNKASGEIRVDCAGRVEGRFAA